MNLILNRKLQTNNRKAMKLRLILPILLAPALAFGQNSRSIPVESKVNEVKLFLSGAQVSRVAAVEIPAGTSVIVLENLPSTLDASTYQVEGKGNFTIMSIKEGFSNKRNSLPKEAQLIKDSISLLLIQKEDIETLKSLLETEEEFLNLNRSIGGQQNGVNATDLKAAAEFYRTRLTEIRKGIVINSRRITEVNQQIERLKARLYPFTSGRVALNQQLSVTVLAEKPTKASVIVSYYTAAAGWVPTYDIRSGGPGKPVQLVLKASANNSTGENWENVHFTYSTGRPTSNVNPPIINPWYLRPIPPRTPSSSSLRLSKVEFAMDEDAYELEEVATVGYMNEFVTTSEAVTATDYSVSIPYTLETGREPLVVEIDRQELQAEFEYIAIPKLAKEVYLMANIVNADRLNLLSANASIYLNNAFTGTAVLSPDMASDTISLPLGQDNAVTISRNRIREFKSKKIIGSRVAETVGWEIEVRSLKSEPINIKVTDQIPVSTDKSIKVEATELSNGSLNAESGLVNWNIKLEPGKPQKIRFGYKVEYPKELILNVE